MIPNEKVRQQVERICQSHVLEQCELLKAFLRYVVDESLEHPGTQPKEYTIATEVFGRDQTFDSRNDAVVRVQARRLRAKLCEYYTADGRDDRILIELPKGHYIPTFTHMHSDKGLAKALGNGHETPVEASVSVIDSAPPVSYSYAGKWTRVTIAALTILCLGLGLAALYYRSRVVQSRGQTDSKSGTRAPDSAELALLWTDFLQSGDPILVTYSNTTFLGTPQKGLRYYKPLEAGGQKSGFGPFRKIGTRTDEDAAISDHYTGIGEVMAVNFLGNLFWKIGRPFRVKRSLLLDWEDIKTGHVVVLGSTAENLFLRDLPQKQDFVFRPGADPGQDLLIVNSRPRPGEPESFSVNRQGPSTSQIAADHAVVSLLRGLDGKNKLMILAGLTTIGTQAAAEYVTRPEYVQDLISHLNTSTDGGAPKLPAFYQVVIKAKVNGGVPVQIEYVTHHVL